MARYTTESSRRIEMTWLKKQNYLPVGGATCSGTLRWVQNGEPNGSIGIIIDTLSDIPSITFNYKTKDYWVDEEWKPMKYSFRLEKLPCRYGGVKWFFRCGLTRGGIYCGKRVRILYGVGGYYGCRICANLTYESCNENKRYRQGVFGFLSKHWKAEDFLETIPRTHYRGKPTRKYRRYMKMTSCNDPYAVDRAIEQMNILLGGKDNKKS